MSLAVNLAGLVDPAMIDIPGADWETPAERRQRVQRAASNRRRQALAEVAQVASVNAARPVRGYESDAELRMLAGKRAELMEDRISAACHVITVDWINGQAVPLGARAFAPLSKTRPEENQLNAIVKRVTHHLWWRRQLRRACVRTRENLAILDGEVCARRRQVYVTNDTVRRYALADQSNRAMLEATELESADGEIIQLMRAIESSTANPAIRRGELMTRLRGCEELGEAMGMVGIFTTNTCPSRFHAQLLKGGANPNYRGGTPREAQDWLRSAWARTRAAWHRLGLRAFGFRVAEPHHDGCPHWHMLLWCQPEQADQLRAVMRSVWLGRPRWFCINGKRNANRGKPLFTDMIAGAPREHRFESGAWWHRFQCKTLEKGGAVSYVAKYISKGIDDAGSIGAEGHRDERDGEQADMFGGTATRVQRWAAAWGIRQFQAIGQPPVTAWREMRRVSELAAQGASDRLRAAHAAVNKTAGRRACWRAYMEAQGGPMRGRAYAIKVIDDGEPREGRYGTEYRPRPVGVYDVDRPDEWILSDRREWKPRGAWAPAERLTWREEMPFTAAGRANLAAQAQRDELLTAIREYRDVAGYDNRGHVQRLQARADALARPQAAQPWTRVINCTPGPRPHELMGLGLVGLNRLKTEPGGSTDRKSSDGPHRYPPDRHADRQPIQPGRSA